MKDKLKNINHIYAICDENKEKNRYDYLKNWMEKDFDSNYFTLSAYCYGDSLSEYDLNKYNIHRNLNIGNKSLALNHIKIFEYFLKNYKDGDNILILESDSIPVENYKEIINDQMKILEKSKWYFLDVGNGIGWNPSRFDHVLNKKNDVYLCKSTRCAHSIIWSYSGIEKFLKKLQNWNIEYVIDHTLHQVLLTFDEVLTYWGHPFAIKQGSQCGTYSSVNF